MCMDTTNTTALHESFRTHCRARRASTGAQAAYHERESRSAVTLAWIKGEQWALDYGPQV